MRRYFKFILISSVLFLTSACQDTLDTSSPLAKEQSIKQMMVGIYPQNQKIFKQALNIIYDADQAIHLNLTKDESIALTDKKIHGKTVEDILHLSFISKKQIQLKPEKSEEELTTVVTVSKTPKLEIIKATFDTK